jgi:hypothetical protein
MQQQAFQFHFPVSVVAQNHIVNCQNERMEIFLEEKIFLIQNKTYIKLKVNKCLIHQATYIS